ncbi:MAG: hypothetical protein NVSMB48_18190 [Marmoricola sp.]
MNQHQAYERRTDRTLDEQNPPETTAPEHSALATHRDPSRAVERAEVSRGETAQKGQRNIAWIRPSELPTTLGSPMLRRGIDLEAELARRARQTPAQAAWRVRRRITRNAIGRPEPATPTISDQGMRL